MKAVPWRAAADAILALTVLLSPPSVEPGRAACDPAPLAVQVLGSGGPELADGRASSGYLLWVDGRARLLVDAGGGSALRFSQAGADFADLAAVVLTHLHVDHSADLAVYIKASYFGSRTAPLPVYGPTGSERMPSLSRYLPGLIGAQSRVYRYLSDFLGEDGGARYLLKPQDVAAQGRGIAQLPRLTEMELSAVPVHHGPVPALAWRVEARGKTVVFSGDMNGDYDTLPSLAKGADLLVAHHAIPESATGVARQLHMPPSLIGTIARKAEAKQLVLSHRMARTLGRESDSLNDIRRNYAGPVTFAEDLDCFFP
jgi:ribonuclease BN (tRNA processing enzyme)